MKTKIIITMMLVLTLAQPTIAKIKESKNNRYADGAQFSAGAKIAVIVTKQNYTAQGYLNSKPVGDLIETRRWASGKYYAKGSTVVLKELIRELKARGYQPHLVQKPSDVKPGEYVIVPNIALRKAKLKGKTVRWDGAKELVKAKGPRTGDTTWSGTRDALSLTLNAYNPEGNWLFKSFGGVAIPSTAHLRTAEYIIKEDIYDDPKLISNGIQQVLLALKKVEVPKAIDYQSVKFSEVMKNPLRFKVQKCQYKEYLEQPNHKAFFVYRGHDGSFAMGYHWDASSVKEAINQARSSCESEGYKCDLFDLDGELVAQVKNLDLSISCHYEQDEVGSD